MLINPASAAGFQRTIFDINYTYLHAFGDSASGSGERRESGDVHSPRDSAWSPGDWDSRKPLILNRRPWIPVFQPGLIASFSKEIYSDLWFGFRSGWRPRQPGWSASGRWSPQSRLSPLSGPVLGAEELQLGNDTLRSGISLRQFHPGLSQCSSRKPHPRPWVSPSMWWILRPLPGRSGLMPGLHP